MKIHHAQLQDTTNRAASVQVDGVWQMAPATTAGQERASANHTADLTRSKRWGNQEHGVNQSEHCSDGGLPDSELPGDGLSHDMATANHLAEGFLLFF